MQLMRSEGIESADSAPPSERLLAAEENKIETGLDALAFPRPELCDQEQEDLFDMMREEEKMYGSTRSMDFKDVRASEPKLNTSADLEEERELHKPIQNAMTIVERSQEVSQNNYSRICKAEDVFHDEVDEEEKPGYGAFSEPEQNLPERVRYNRFYRLFYRICTHGVFGTIIIMLIVANTVVLALDRHPIDQNEFEALGILISFTLQNSLTRLCHGAFSLK